MYYLLTQVCRGMKKLNRIVAGLTGSIGYLLSSGLVHAQDFQDCGPGKTYSPDFQICIPTEAPEFASAIYQLGLGLLGLVAVLFLIFGGYNIMMSRGNLAQFEKGKSFIFYSIAGLLLAIFGFIFIEIVTGDILQLRGFGK